MRPTGRAIVDPTDPQAFAICDRCGLQFNHSDLTWQYEWSGTRFYNKRLLVCRTCLDNPSPFLRTLIVPADPPPVLNARIEPFAIDAVSQWTIRPNPLVMIGRMDVDIEITS